MHEGMTSLVIMAIIVRSCKLRVLLLNLLTSLQEIMMNVVDVLRLLQLLDLFFKRRLNINILTKFIRIYDIMKSNSNIILSVINRKEIRICLFSLTVVCKAEK